MSINTIFFDLDDTLYPRNSGVWEAVRSRIESYMRERLRIPRSKIGALRQEYLTTYGSSLRGLMDNYNIDPDDYLLYVHDVPIEEMIRPSAKLARMLSRLPQSKWVFTNASLAHARRVLSALGASRHFAGVLDVKAMSFRSKPDADSYRLALDTAGQNRAATTLFVDDQAANLQPAKTLGAATVLVGTHEPHPAADHSIAAVEHLLTALPGLVE
ncbi:MAG: pyrimidine 5'-nucleotidase [Anaerolineales bacterium]